MPNRKTVLADLMKERLTPEELWQLQSWWAEHPRDLEQNNAYLRERTTFYAEAGELLARGLPPSDSAVQEEVAKHNALLERHGVRARTVRMMDWNLALTTRFMELGAIAREREPERDVLPFPLLGHRLAQFLDQAMAVSAPAQALDAPLRSAQDLLQGRVDPGSSAADAVTADVRAACAAHHLGDPVTYLRFIPFLCRVNHRPLAPSLEAAHDFLVTALRQRQPPLPAAPPASGSLAGPPPAAFTPEELFAVRRGYARQMGLMAGIIDARVEAAFSAVPREAFLGAGPWSVLSTQRGTFITTPDDSPAHLYGDNVVAIDATRRLNNGQPSLYYRLFALAGVAEGAHIVHVGAGTGYYSALLAHLTGPAGRVTAIEYEPPLAARAQANLEHLPQVEVLQGDATQMPFAAADLIVVSAGLTHPPAQWLDALKEDGQLILPLTSDAGTGVIFGIRRRGARYFAAMLSAVMIYACAGGRDPQAAAALAAALKGGGQEGVTRLYRGQTPPAANCWLSGQGWSLAYG